MGWQDRDYNREDGGGGFGGGGGFASRLSGASVVTWLLGINCAVFILDYVLSSGMRTPSWASPMDWGEFTFATAIQRFQVWRFFTYQFFHAGFFHLLFNMIGLFFFGPMIERWWGSRRFLAFYLLCGMSGAVIYSLIVWLAPGIIFDIELLQQVKVAPADIPVVGASGSLFGILVACAVLYPKQRVMLLIPPIPMSMRTMALIFLGIAVLTLIVGSQNAGGEAAHLGGALLGFVLVKFPRSLDWADRLSPTAIQKNVNAGRFERKKKAEADDQAEVDRILDKVKAEGLASLTNREKKTLQRATDRGRGG